MKRFAFISLFLFFAMGARAQHNPDSLAYQLQRAKINAMLAQRAQKFGQYGESLAMHTGIFGLQTKKDIRRSNDILMDIVKTDDEIYKQLKILLDFRAYQQTQVQSRAYQAEENTVGYMDAINKLRNQVDRLKDESARQQRSAEKSSRRFAIALGLLLLTILMLLIWRGRKIA